MTTPEPAPGSRPAPGPLAQSLVALAEMPDDVAAVDDQLVLITRLAVEQVAAVRYASVTATREGGPTTVAASSELARAVDDAQYADGAGPCLEPLRTGQPAGVPDIAATMQWPGFRDQALRMGLRTSVSVPLFAGSGTPVAVLNLHGHDPAAMATVIDGVWEVFRAGRPPGGDIEPGAADLMAGLAEALVVRSTIRQAVEVVMARRGVSALDAYLHLRDRAAAAGLSLAAAAAAMVRRGSP